MSMCVSLRVNIFICSSTLYLEIWQMSMNFQVSLTYKHVHLCIVWIEAGRGSSTKTIIVTTSINLSLIIICNQNKYCDQRIEQWFYIIFKAVSHCRLLIHIIDCILYELLTISNTNYSLWHELLGTGFFWTTKMYPHIHLSIMNMIR